jgi:hypothetical protein
LVPQFNDKVVTGLRRSRVVSMTAVGDPFVDAGMWLRCALHAHTTRSDGELEPDELVRHYAGAEFDVLAITDHWIRTEAESTGRLLVVPSSELSCRLPDEADGHLLAFGIDEDPLEFVRTRPDLAEAAAWVAGHGGVASSSRGGASRPSTGTSCSSEGCTASASPRTTRTTVISTASSPGSGHT